MIDEDVLGKAYDSRLMQRLLTYLRPYCGQVILAVVAIIGHSVLDLAPPYLTKIVIDRYIPLGDLGGLRTIAALYLIALIIVPSRVPPDVDDAGDRTADHVRPEDGARDAPASAGSSFYDRNLLVA